ncbi:MAG: helix-turn-helix domain-containing protein [Paludibacteraceae bacterium]|nr:helix-turn-helix domain-containing protein [Paludibacteraceae bacterium]
MHERIKELRRLLGESQDSFASKLNISRNFIWMIEKGEREPSDRTILDICRVFNVNEQWIRTGAGEVFKPKDRETEIAEITSILFNSDDDFKAKLIRILIDMDETQIELLKDIAIKIADATKDLP